MNKILALAALFLASAVQAAVVTATTIVRSTEPAISSGTLTESRSFAALKAWKPVGVVVVGGVVPWDKEFGPGGGGSAYISFQPFKNKYLKPVTLQPGFGLWYQKTQYVSKDSFAYVDDENGLALFDDIRDDKTVTRRVVDLGKVTYALKIGRFTPYVGVGLASAKRVDVFKTTDHIRIFVDGEPQIDETIVSGEGKTTQVKTEPYLNAGLKVAVNRSWSALADYATSPILGPRLSLGVQYLLR